MLLFQKKTIDIIRNNCYIYSLGCMLVAMPLSKALLSFSIVLLFISWFLAPRFYERFSILKTRKSLFIFWIGFLVVVLGLLYSENLHRNVFLLVNIKISLLILPLVIGTFEPLNKKELSVLLLLFTLANLIATLISTLILFQVIRYEFSDIRQISIFISSVRFALLLSLNIMFLIFAFTKINSQRWRYFIAFSGIWFIVFLFVMQALTGILAIFVTGIIVLFVFRKKVSFYAKSAAILVVVGLCVYIVTIANNAFDNYFSVRKENFVGLDSVTVNKNVYQHNLNDSSRVNGYLVWVYVCEPELRAQWTKRSTMPFDGVDNRGWVPVKYTLMQYLSSMGLRKDSAAIAKLNKWDIEKIEQGYNNKEMAGIGLNARFYDIIREFDCWIKTGKPDGSITIRLNALQTGWHVFINNLWIGTGFGDINDDIQHQYNKDLCVFGNDIRQNVHNQFLTFLIGAGIIGLLLFLFSFIFPGIIEKKFHSYLFLVAFVITIFSFITDDTLERMVGCIIMAFFFSITLYAIPEDLS